MTELAVLQAVRLKGRVTLADLAATLDEDLDDVTKAAEQLTESGLLVGGATLRISPGGRERLDALLAAERKGIDTAAMAAAYDDFRSVNPDFKALVTEWQLKGGPAGKPNTHDDAEYDAAVLTRLDEVHAQGIADHRRGRGTTAAARLLFVETDCGTGQNQSRRQRLAGPAAHRLLPHRVVRIARRADRRRRANP